LPLITKISYRNLRKAAMRLTIKNIIKSTINKGVAEVPDTASMWKCKNQLL
jgi:hypothetical protein